MAETFDNFKSVLDTTASTIYTCPASTVAIVLLIQVTNVDGLNEADATVLWVDSSDSSAETELIKSAPVPAGSALNVLGGKLVLKAGDSIKAYASAASDLKITGSVVEMS